MTDWKSLLAAPRFRALWIALVLANLGSWAVLATLPILVAERFGDGGALVMSLGWRILPKILLAPVAGMVLRRFGASRVACVALLAEAAFTVAIPWCHDFVLLQCAIAGIGAVDVFMMPGLWSLRGTVTPPGLEMASNSLFSMADRSCKMIGAVLGGVALAAGFGPEFLGCAVLIALSAIPVFGLPRPGGKAKVAGGWQLLGLATEFRAMLRHDRALLGLVVAVVSYMFMLGGLRPFLFWANREWFGAGDGVFAGLLAAQGMGAVIGALVAGFRGRALSRLGSAYLLTMLTSIVETLGLMALLLCPSGPAGAVVAMGILAFTGIPEVISTATWFTVVQQRLSPERQGLYFAMTSPLWDCAYAVGVLSAGLHAGGFLGLAPWWLLLSVVATVALPPVLFWDAKSRPIPLSAG
jgi:hypothetical protein